MITQYRDPVCGMIVLPDQGIEGTYGGTPLRFCSTYCADKFCAHPGQYATIRLVPEDSATESRRFAYFSMEVAIDPRLPSYAGGLGVLAGDMLRSCADLRVPIVGVTLLHRKGYFEQVFDEMGMQIESPSSFTPADLLIRLPETVTVEVEGRTVHVAAWQYEILGVKGYRVPLVMLDCDLEENADCDRRLTDHLYGGDRAYRLSQEIVLGMGGARMLRALGYAGIQRYHINEGHASLLLVELLEWLGGVNPSDWDFEGARDRAVFTTHTVVEAGHDKFDYDLVERILGNTLPIEVLKMLAGTDQLNMTRLALNLCRYVNGVAQRHGEVSRVMFPGYPIRHITNGVHSVTWTSESFKALYDQHLPGWRERPAVLRNALIIPDGDLWEAHLHAKQLLMATRCCKGLHEGTLTIGFARRAALYKRADLIFDDIQRLKEIARQAGPIQFVFAGKAHPQDGQGKEIIRRIIEISRELGSEVPVVYLENYDTEIAKLLVSGVDLWLNTPERPLEASGTSGMKAAHNGVPSLSTLDGWWVEGHIEGVTGWSVGTQDPQPREADAQELYEKLETRIVQMFYVDREQWIDMMRQSISVNASHFNTHRMVQEYCTSAYLE